MQRLSVLLNVCVLIFVYYLAYSVYIGLLYPIPEPGDSVDYHIPIAESILDGRFLSLSHAKLPQWYYPGSAEILNAFFVFFHIPTLANIFAVIIFCFSCWQLGKVFRLSPHYSGLFALACSSLTVVLRWINDVSIDVWVGVFFVLSLVLLERPKKSVWYFLQLGFVSGMLIGSKYTTILFLFVFVVLYGKSIILCLNLKRFLAFSLPFSLFGLFWYVRNYWLTGNPFYPLGILGFKGALAFPDSVLKISRAFPLVMFNAGFGEYKFWLFSLVVAVVMLFYQFVIRRSFQLCSMTQLFLLGLTNFICFLYFPTSSQSWIMVSSFRYSLPAFVPLILGVFLLGAKYKREEWVGYIVVANMISVLSIAYYPKLLFVSVPVSFVIFYFMQRHYNES